jgi:hypothetical protein
MSVKLGPLSRGAYELRVTAASSRPTSKPKAGGFTIRGASRAAYRRQVAARQLRGGLAAVDGRHLPVHDDDVGREVGDACQALLAGGCFAGEDEAGRPG